MARIATVSAVVATRATLAAKARAAKRREMVGWISENRAVIRPILER